MWWPSATETVSTDGTVGVLLIATLVAAMLYGITVLQSMQYYDRFYNDSRVLKFLVLVLWLFESTTIVTEIHAVYVYSVTNAGKKFGAVSVPWSLPLERAFAFAAVYLVQMFFAFRVWQLGRRVRSRCLPVFIGLAATTTVVLGLIATIEGYHVNNVPRAINALSAISAGFQIVIDALIVFSLYWLNRDRVSGDNNSVLGHFFVSAVNRGVFSTLLQIFATATYFTVKPQLVWIAFHMASSKVHAISLLSTLNTRMARDGIGHDTEIIDARIRDRLEKELGGHGRGFSPDTPPNLPTIAHGLPCSPSSWFASKSDGGLESWTPSYHARSTTAVDGASGAAC